LDIVEDKLQAHMIELRVEWERIEARIRREAAQETEADDLNRN
jgi:hypothetical protein